MDIELDGQSLDWIGNRIFQNECAGQEACLVHWNEGEAFPSLGIGHFIWYPSGIEGPFVESFPAMMEYLESQGAELPAWLKNLEPFDAPWPDREAFLRSSENEQVERLRKFLVDTKGLQAEFLYQRAKRALGRVIAAAPKQDRAGVSGHIDALAATAGGVYALIDYVNFKGEGLALSERYQGQGWGLLQVLQAMEIRPEKTALQSFRESAKRVLARRAQLADKSIEKTRWLPGWLNRLNTYREPGPE